MKRRATILWAYISCSCYLLVIGMWRGECRLTMHGITEGGVRLMLLAAYKDNGSLLSNKGVTKIFYEDKSYA